jgi:hypothetical protein
MNADGVSATGKEYHNQYHDLLEIRDGKIETGREYLDTAHTQEVIVEGGTGIVAPDEQNPTVRARASGILRS